MSERIEILSGNQHDPRGVCVIAGHLDASVSLGKRQDGTVGLVWAGTYSPRATDRAVVETAIHRVLATRIEETVELVRIEETQELESSAPICRHCGTVCYGDCRA